MWITEKGQGICVYMQPPVNEKISLQVRTLCPTLLTFSSVHTAASLKCSFSGVVFEVWRATSVEA